MNFLLAIIQTIQCDNADNADNVRGALMSESNVKKERVVLAALNLHVLNNNIFLKNPPF